MAVILVVDDSPTEMEKFKSILLGSGHQVIEATNGADGVLLAEEHQPDLILMDVVMPNMNGFQATRMLSRSPKTSHIPIIIVSTKDQETDRIWGKRQGATEYIVKPVDGAGLLEFVNQVLKEHG